MRLGLRRLEGLIAFPGSRFDTESFSLRSPSGRQHQALPTPTNLPEAQIGVNWTKVSLELHSARSGWRR